MEQILNDAFRVMQQGIAAINAAKTVETGTPAGNVTLARPVVSGPSAVPWKLIGGLAVAGLVAFLVFKKR